MADGDNDGLDTVYDPGGLAPVDTDGDDIPDIFDDDTDGDNVLDIAERDNVGPSSVTSLTDSDNDGLLDIFESGTVNDNFDVNDQNLSGTTFILLDSDNDTNANGSNAAPTSIDLDYRDTNPVVRLDTNKEVEIYDPDMEGLYFLPGNDVIYRITVTNTGPSAPDIGSLFLADSLPPEVEFYNSDIDDTGPETGVVAFTQTGSSVTFSPITDLRFSNSTIRPSSFANCNYTPVAGYDPNVTFVCFNPNGVLKAGTPNPSFALSFRARIR